MVFVWIFLVLLGLYVIASAVFAVLGIRYGFLRTLHTEYFSNTGTSARHPFRERIERDALAVSDLLHEDRYLTSFDGLRLHAALFRTAYAKGLIVCVHGFHSRADKDFAPLVPFYLEQGYHVLLVDQRAHMESEGWYAAYGVLERNDLRDWIADCAAQFGSTFPIWLHGESMGAATCMSVADLPLMGNVRGIIEDSGFDTPSNEVRYTFCKNFRFPPYPGVWFVALFCRLRLRMPLYGVSAKRALQRTRIPCLFIHGDADDIVPLFSGVSAYAACASDKELWVVPKTGHCAAYYTAEAEYRSRLLAFLNRTRPAGSALSTERKPTLPTS